MRRSVWWFIMAVVVCGAEATPAWAADPIALSGAKIYPVSGDPIESGVVLIDDEGKIEAVGATGSVSVPKGYEIIELKGKIITPGLFDAHSALGLVEIELESSLRDTSSGEDRVNAAVDVADAFHERSATLAVQRSGGVTDVIVAPSGGVVFGQSAHVELLDVGNAFAQVAERKVAQYIALGDAAVRVVGGSRATLAAALRELYEDVAFFEKNEALFNQNRARKLSASAGSLKALGRGKREGQPVAFLAEMASDISFALEFAKEQGLPRPIIVGGAEAWLVAEELKEADAAVILQPMTNLPDTLESVAARQDNAALLEEAGVAVMYATFDAHNARRIRSLAGNAVRAGVSYQGALRSITLTVAERFGIAASHGSIEPGKWANLVVWSGDPFEFSSQAERVYIHGTPASLEHRQRQLFERYRTLERRDTPAPSSRPDRANRAEQEETL